MSAVQFSLGGNVMRTLIGAALVAAIAVPAQAAPVNSTAMQSTIKYSRTPTTASGFGNFTRATSTVVYDSATGTYTLRDTSSLSLKSSFTTADIDAGASNATFTVYDKSSGSNVETFRKLNNSGANPLIVLSYVTYGQWRRSATSGSTTTVNDTYVVWGSKTATTPTTGAGTYSTVLDGTFANKSGVYAVTGTGNFTANFGSGTISYDATASGAREGGGPGIAFGTMTGSGSIAYKGAGFTGTGGVNGSGYSLDVAGNFYGPNAEEIGGTFRLRGNGGNGTGAIVGN
jgi:hypothetical protein